MLSRLFPITLATVLVIGFAGTASAQTRATISKMRQWCCTTPSAFIAGNPAVAAGYQTKFPFVETGGGPTPTIMVDYGEVNSFSIPRSWCNYGACTFPAIPGFKYIKGAQTAMNPSATFSVGGGPTTTVDYCFNGPGVCSPPATSGGTAIMNGRMTVKPGANKFGGTMSQIIDTIPTSLARWLNTAMTGSPWSRAEGGATQMGIGNAVVWIRLENPGPRQLISGPASTVLQSTPNAYLQMNGAGPFQTGSFNISITMNFNPQLGPTLAINLKGYDNRTVSRCGPHPGCVGSVLQRPRGFLREQRPGTPVEPARARPQPGPGRRRRSAPAGGPDPRSAPALATGASTARAADDDYGRWPLGHRPSLRRVNGARGRSVPKLNRRPAHAASR